MEPKRAGTELWGGMIHGFDTGLRWIKPEGSWLPRFLHSDIDLQFIVQDGILKASKVDVAEFVTDLNKNLGRNLFQHGDNFTGMLHFVSPRANYTRQIKSMILINSSGFIGQGHGVDAMLGWLPSQDRRTISVLLEYFQSYSSTRQ